MGVPDKAPELIKRAVFGLGVGLCLSQGYTEDQLVTLLKKVIGEVDTFTSTGLVAETTNSMLKHLRKDL